MMIWTTREAFLRELGTLYDAKQRFLEAQEEMAAQAHDLVLAHCLRQHLAHTEQHLANLDRISERLSEQRREVETHTARGLAQDIRAAIDSAGTLPLRDWLIASWAITIKQAEIGVYGGLITAARGLGLSHESLHLLQDNRDQDRQTVQELEALAPELLHSALREEGRPAVGANARPAQGRT